MVAVVVPPTVLSYKPAARRQLIDFPVVTQRPPTSRMVYTCLHEVRVMAELERVRERETRGKGPLHGDQSTL